MTEDLFYQEFKSRLDLELVGNIGENFEKIEPRLQNPSIDQEFLIDDAINRLVYLANLCLDYGKFEECIKYCKKTFQIYELLFQLKHSNIHIALELFYCPFSLLRSKQNCCRLQAVRPKLSASMS